MSGELAAANKIVGLKQFRKALKAGKITVAYLADDADPLLSKPLLQACMAGRIEVIHVPTMRELGTRCGISVPSACAAIVR